MTRRVGARTVDGVPQLWVDFDGGPKFYRVRPNVWRTPLGDTLQPDWTPSEGEVSAHLRNA